MEKIEEGYVVPTELLVRGGEIGDQTVVILDMQVIMPGVNMEPQRAVLVLIPQDALAVSDMLYEASGAGEEN